LDYDGTLAPFRARRENARPYDGVTERLDKLINHHKTTVVLISGRAIDDLKPLLNLTRLPEIWGSHGWELLSVEGRYKFQKMDEKYVQGLKQATNFMHLNRLQQYMEVKPASIAIHYRGVEPKIVLEVEKKVSFNWKGLAIEFQLDYSEFDGGLEIKAPGFTKGGAVRTVLKRYPGDTIAAFLGDDQTDEDAFEALPESGLGILVRPEWRPTAATAWLKPPRELLDFFDRWLTID
jgi:trehalose-phosphatase